MFEWKTVKVGDLVKINVSSYSKSDKWEFVNYLDTGNITANAVDEIQRIDLAYKKLPSRARRKVCLNDIVYSTVRPNQRHYGIIKSVPDNFLVSTGFAVLRCNQEKIIPDYLYFLLSHNDIVDSLHSIAEQSVSAYPSLKPSDIANLEITLPDLDTQKKIASVLMSITSKIEKNNEINKNLEQQAHAIFISEFTQLDGIPAGWEKSNLLEIANYLNGLAMQKHRPSDDEVGIPVLKIKELRQGSFDSNSGLCSPSIKPEYIVHDGDVIFSWSGSLLVDFWCGGTCGLNQHLFKVTSTKYDKWFYYAWTNYHLEKFAKIAADMATTMGHIKREELSNSEVLIPSETDYHRIGGFLTPIYDLMILNRLENVKLANLRDSLLPKLMSGETDVSDIKL